MYNETLIAPLDTATTSLTERYQQVRQQTEYLCAPLKTEDYVVQPIEDVSPPKWHLAHTTWFFESFILAQYQPNYRVFDASFNYVFNSYYESMGEKMLRHHRGNMTRPSTEEIYRYRAHVDEQMQRLIDSAMMEKQPDLASLIILGLHHEQQHQELLLTDIKFILGNNPLFPVYLKQDILPTHEPLKAEYVTIDGGIYPIGFQGEGFHFDNEEGNHQVYLHDFRILNRLVTNGEYLEFMEDEGYSNFDLWLADGRTFVLANNIQAPAYWHQRDGQWHYYTLHGGLQPVDPHAPVTHVSYYEAEAFARWKEKRLPTEFEWETACNTMGYDRDLHVAGRANLVEDAQYHPQPAPTDAAAGMITQMIGDVWEWTQSAYLPYPFYQRVKGALGEYNGKFMVDQMVLRGGSCATPESHIRPTYRNFFQTDKRWQFTGIRLAEHLR